METTAARRVGTSSDWGDESLIVGTTLVRRGNAAVIPGVTVRACHATRLVRTTPSPLGQAREGGEETAQLRDRYFVSHPIVIELFRAVGECMGERRKGNVCD